jgi:hypothetical protein
MTQRPLDSDNASPETERRPPRESIDEIEIRPDGEERFKAAVRAAAKSGPMHRPGKGAKR